jgi:VanZ family protein
VALIFSLSSLSKPPIPQLGWNASDKFYHVIEYAVLSFLLGQALVGTVSRLSLGFAGTIAMLVAVLLGACDEWYQSFVPERYSTTSDWVADSLGGVLGGLFVYVWHWFRARRFR